MIKVIGLKGGFSIKRIILPLLLMIFILTGCGFSSNKDRLVVGIDEDFAPMSFHDESGEIVGFEIDLAKEAARRMGVRIEFKPIDWDKKEEEITSGNIDMIWNGLDITNSRKEYMIFSKPYMDDRQILLASKDIELDIHSEYDLEGKTVGAQSGSTSDDYVNQNKEIKSIIKEYRVYSKFNDMINALLKDEIEVIVCDELIARYNMNLYPNKLKIINIHIGAIAETGIGFRKDNVELRDRVQKTFNEMINDGTASQISLRWFNADLIKRFN